MVTVNGRPVNIEGELSVQQLLAECRFTYPMIIVRINGIVIPEDRYATTLVSQGDTVDAIHMVAGG
ncbi:MAG: sulfur carrier protein ThiS [Candidatus Eremiobacteraeota bacterium]|nr:sulfur carrier protein ThiS [Candidatus Eremiobacteraeota bacterium]